MSNKNINLVANKLVKAFLKSKIILPIPSRYTKKIAQIYVNIGITFLKSCGAGVLAITFFLSRATSKVTPSFLVVEEEILNRNIKLRAIDLLNNQRINKQYKNTITKFDDGTTFEQCLLSDDIKQNTTKNKNSNFNRRYEMMVDHLGKSVGHKF